MSRQPVDPNWFTRLPRVRMQEHLKWLSQLRTSIENIASFGCWGSSESLALMWTLNATEVKGIEKKKEHFSEAEEELECLRKEIPAAFEGRSVEFILADMSTEVAELPSNYFDLAYCEKVLDSMYMESDCQKVRDAIREMARVVKPGGWVIAVEPKIGVEFKEVTDDYESKLFGCKITKPVRMSSPKDISSLFKDAGLVRDNRVKGTPNGAYCYRKKP